MIDRIANPWGTRTPFGRDEEWPVRVDQFLEAGVGEEEVDEWVQTASILHSNGDALDIAVKDGRIVGVRGRPVDRVNKGRLDPKDLFGWQANNSGDRLTKPLVRRDGELVEASWDEAFDRIVGESKRLLEEKGPLAFGFYSGALVAEDERHGLHGQLVERFRGQLGEAAYTFVACLFALGISGLAAYLADVPVPVWGAKEGARSSV